MMKRVMKKTAMWSPKVKFSWYSSYHVTNALVLAVPSLSSSLFLVIVDRVHLIDDCVVHGVSNSMHINVCTPPLNRGALLSRLYYLIFAVDEH